MRRFARLPSRVLAVAGAMVLGAIFTIALASPASATYPKITSDVACGPTADTAIVTWTVANQFDKDATITAVSRTVEGLVANTPLPGKQKVSGTETVKLADKKFKITVTVDYGWGGKSYDGSADVTKLDCTPKPTAKFVDNCDGTTVVTVTNPADGVESKIAVNGSNGFLERNLEFGPGDTWTVTVPAGDAQPVRVKYVGGDLIDKHTWARPEKCHTVVAKSDCDNLVITVTNEGLETIEVTVKAGDEEKTEEIGNGDKVVATITGSEGLVATVTVVDGGKKFTQEVKYEKPSDCAPTLPVTGVNAGLLAGAALVLVSGGVGLFFVARRRRIRFAA